MQVTLTENGLKSKKSNEKAVEKVRAEMRNQLDTVRNELAKAKAEWQRERKKIMNEHEEALSAQQRDTDLNKDSDVRATRDKVEKVWRKRLDEQAKDFEYRNQQLESEMDEVREKHRDELSKER